MRDYYIHNTVFYIEILYDNLVLRKWAVVKLWIRGWHQAQDAIDLPFRTIWLVKPGALW